jgi:dihydrofolate reductase
VQCSVYIAVTVDGFIAREDGSLDYLDMVQVKDEDYGYQAFADSVDCLVIGRATYDLARGFPQWPYEGKRVVVVTRREISAAHGEERFEGDVAELVERLRADRVQRVYVDGGQIIRAFLAKGLVDDITLSTIPILLGKGIRLFDGGPEMKLALDGSDSYPSGLVQQHYRVLR